LDIVLLVLNIIIIVGVSVVSILGKGFFSEKAKNLATKKDISEITEKIESIKSHYAHELEKSKAQLQVSSELKKAFQSKSLEALIAINDLLVEIHLYCWKEIANRSPNEHYVWSNVDDSDEKRGLHYFRVAVDKVKMVHGLYLSEIAKESLSELAGTIGTISNTELYLSDPTADEAIKNSASSNYRIVIEAVEKCRKALFEELGN
jgi:hypothetical protein